MIRWRTTRGKGSGSDSCPTVEEIKTAVTEALTEYGVCTGSGTTNRVITVSGDAVVTTTNDPVVHGGSS